VSVDSGPQTRQTGDTSSTLRFFRNKLSKSHRSHFFATLGRELWNYDTGSHGLSDYIARRKKFELIVYKCFTLIQIIRVQVIVSKTPFRAVQVISRPSTVTSRCADMRALQEERHKRQQHPYGKSLVCVNGRKILIASS
jgi:hypothetical protein